jgi:hypothetical protein
MHILEEKTKLCKKNSNKLYCSREFTSMTLSRGLIIVIIFKFLLAMYQVLLFYVLFLTF